jgi:hypothetical protein
MVDRPWAFHGRVDPRLDHLEDEEVVLRGHPRVDYLSLTTQPRTGGSKSSMVCQDMVMTFGRPFFEVVIITTGPGSNKL